MSMGEKTTLVIKRETLQKIKELMRKYGRYEETYNSFFSKAADIIDLLARKYEVETLDQLISELKREVRA